MTVTVKDGTYADALLMTLPLRGEVTQAVVDDLNTSGRGKRCAGCDKPFTLARKQRAVCRQNHIDPASGWLFQTAWILCGPCSTAIRRNGGRIPVHLLEEALAAASAGLLLDTPAKGNA